MVLDPLLGDYNDVSQKITNFVLKNLIYPHDNRKKIRAKRAIGCCQL